jgi:hypothetical protein
VIGLKSTPSENDCFRMNFEALAIRTGASDAGHARPIKDQFSDVVPTRKHTTALFEPGLQPLHHLIATSSFPGVAVGDESRGLNRVSELRIIDTLRDPNPRRLQPFDKS